MKKAAILVSLFFLLFLISCINRNLQTNNFPNTLQPIEASTVQLSTQVPPESTTFTFQNSMDKATATPELPEPSPVVFSTLSFADLTVCGEDALGIDATLQFEVNNKFIYQKEGGKGLFVYDGQSREVANSTLDVIFLGVSIDENWMAYTILNRGGEDKDDDDELQINLYSVTGEYISKSINIEEAPFMISPGDKMYGLLPYPASYWNNDGTISLMLMSTDNNNRSIRYYDALIDPLLVSFAEDRRSWFPDYDQNGYMQLSPDRRNALYSYSIGSILDSDFDFGFRLISLPNKELVGNFSGFSFSSFPFIKWSPDSSSVVMSSRLPLFDKIGINIIDDEGKLRNLYDVNFGANLYSIEWSPDNHYLGMITGNDRLILHVFDNVQNKYKEQCSIGDYMHSPYLFWSPNSQNIFIRHQMGSTGIYDLESGTMRILPYEIVGLLRK